MEGEEWERRREEWDERGGEGGGMGWKVNQINGKEKGSQ